jgi:SAM-dependent methyltransferase
MDRKAQWEDVYAAKPEDAVSWYTPHPRLSLDLIAAAAPDRRSRIIDVGGGASVLVDRLLDRGYENIIVLDISAAALGRSKHRLGRRAGRARWVVADVTGTEDLGRFDVWHDRAVLHFLTEAEDRRRYAEAATRAVVSGGHAVVSAFSLQGPPS